MGLKALDLSNYTSPLTVEQASQLVADGYGMVLIEAVDPLRPGAPLSQFLAQVEAAEGAGLPWQPYIYIYLGNYTQMGSEEWMARCLRLLDQAADQGWLPHPIRILGQDVAGWLDIEDDTDLARLMGLPDRVSAIAHALHQFDTWLANHDLPAPGIYTRREYWDRYLPGVTLFRTRLLWDAHYDGDGDDANHDFMPYGGWTAAAIKQFEGTSTVDGILNVDQDVLAEGASIMTVENPTTDSATPPPVPDEYVQKGWTDWYTVAVNERGIADALGQQVTQLQAQLASATANAPQSQEEQAAFTALVSAVEKRFAADLAPLLQKLQQLLGSGGGG